MTLAQALRIIKTEMRKAGLKVRDIPETDIAAAAIELIETLNKPEQPRKGK